jgi:hypothetical protein
LKEKKAHDSCAQEKEEVHVINNSDTPEEQEHSEPKTDLHQWVEQFPKVTEL